MKFYLLLVPMVFSGLTAQASGPTLDDLVSKLRTTQVDVLQLGVNKKISAIAEKLQANFRSNPALLQEVVSKRQPGQPLEYDARFGISKSEYESMLAGLNKMQLMKVGTAQITVTKDSSGKMRITSSTLGSVLKSGVEIGIYSQTAQFMGAGELGRGKAFSNNDGPLAPLNGYTWSNTIATGLGGKKQQLHLAKTAAPNKCLFSLEAKTIENGQALLREEVYFHFDCK